MPFVMMIQPLASGSANVIKTNIAEHKEKEARDNAEKPKEEQVTTPAPAPDSNKLENYLYLLLPSLAVAFLSIHGPNMAMTLLSGGGSTFNASTAAGNIMAMARLPQTLDGFGFMSKKVDNADSKGSSKFKATTLSGQLNHNTQYENIGYDNKTNLSAENIKGKYNNLAENLKHNNNNSKQDIS